MNQSNGRIGKRALGWAGAAALLLLVGTSLSYAWMGGGPMMGMNHGAMMSGPPGPYQRLSNPMAGSAAALQAGAKLYQANCAACHGPAGAGDGPAARSLAPPPAALRYTVRMPMATDGYLFWRISEGGRPFGSAMPAFGGSLNEAQRWQIITFLRNL